jgi:hypothetical protein
MKALSMASIAWFAAGCASAGEPQQPSVDAPINTTPPIDAPPSPCELQLATLGSDFETGASGWSHAVLDGASAPGWPLDEWQVGTATSGPGSCHGGTGCWATRLDANYTSCSRAAVQSPPIDLSVCSGQPVKLKFWSWHDFWTGTVSGKSGTFFDGGLVEVSSDGTSWSGVTPSSPYPGTIVINPNIGSNECVSPDDFGVHNRPGFVGAGGGNWQEVVIALPPAAITSTFHVRFAYSSGVSFANSDAEIDRMHTRPGWYLDDVSFSK